MFINTKIETKDFVLNIVLQKKKVQMYKLKEKVKSF